LTDFAFLICSERSGSNLITSLMGGHREISGPPPSHLFRLFATNAHRYQPLDDDRNWNAFRIDLLDAFANMLGEWNTAPPASDPQPLPDQRSIAAELQRIYGREAAAEGARISFVKENHCYAFAPFLLASYAGCRFVHQVRDPRDVAASWLATDGIAGGVVKAIDTWVSDQTETLTLVRQLQPSGRAMTIRYEDLLADPEAAARLLCAHLGLAFDPGMLEFFTNERTRRNAASIDAWSNLAKPVMRDNAGKFRSVLSSDDLRYVELRCAGLMGSFGYMPETDAGSLGAVERQSEAAGLAGSVNPGRPYKLSTGAEKDRRDRRRAVIDRVLSRAPAQA